MALSGATDANTHQRYLHNTDKAREIPAAALPDLSITDAQFKKLESQNALFSSGRNRGRTCDIRLVRPAAGSSPVNNPRHLRSPDHPCAPLETDGVSNASVQSIPLAERAELLSLARRARAALPPGPSKAREMVVELERRLELGQSCAAGRAEGGQSGA